MESFNNFSIDKQINVGNTSTPLVIFANSKEEDAISINSNFLIGQNPNLIDDEQIFIYAFCEKNLTMLHINIDFSNQEKLSIKPIFLLLHIPKSKQDLPNLSTIIIQIYTFFFCISDLAIVIINEQLFYSQIFSTSFLYSIAQENSSHEQNWNKTTIINNNNEKSVKKAKDDDIPDLKKKANYVLKETENLGEIKVSVEIGKDLKSVIEQDFWNIFQM